MEADSNVDMFCLHLCFMHLIQEELDEFRTSWNAHRIRTAGNRTPKQLFVKGLHDLAVLQQETGENYTELIQVEK